MCPSYAFDHTSLPILALDSTDETAGVMLSTEVLYDRYFPAKQATECLLPAIQDILQQADIKVEALRAIVWNAGPGTFTGLRIAAGVIQGLSVAYDIPVIAVPCFEGWLQARVWHKIRSNFFPSSILCITDARAEEVYWAGFSQSATCFTREHTNIFAAKHGYYAEGPIRVERPQRVMDVLSMASSKNKKTYCLGLGSGFARYPELYQCINQNGTVLERLYTPENLALCLQALIAIAQEQFNGVSDPMTCKNTQEKTHRQDLPLYIRNKVALTLAEQKQQD